MSARRISTRLQWIEAHPLRWCAEQVLLTALEALDNGSELERRAAQSRLADALEALRDIEDELAERFDAIFDEAPGLRAAS
jgi:hypothetical protein